MCDGCYKRIDLSFVRTCNTSQVHEATYRLLDELSCCKNNMRGLTTKFANFIVILILEGLFIMNLYQLDKQSTKFTIWKH